MRLSVGATSRQNNFGFDKSQESDNDAFWLEKADLILIDRVYYPYYLDASTPRSRATPMHHRMDSNGKLPLTFALGGCRFRLTHSDASHTK